MTGRVLQFDPAAHKVADVLLPWLVNGTLEGDELAFVRVGPSINRPPISRSIRRSSASVVAGSNTTTKLPLVTALALPEPRVR